MPQTPRKTRSVASRCYPTLLLCGLAALGCNNRQSIIVPNRVLDRPTEMGLACVTRDESSEVITTTSLEACRSATCGETRLIGFIANSERDDVAMFSTCANSVIDMDESTPGAQLIPAGKVPTTMAITTGSPDACFAVSGNLGSCDLSVFDVTGFAAYAFEDSPVEDPSSLVQTIVPIRGDGTPLGSRPGQIVPVPRDLSNSVLFDDPTPGDESSTSSGGDGGGDESAGESGGAAPVLRCDPERPGSVYVTFPSCQLIAEVDLRTHRLLQSRQFIRADDGTVDVVDAGVDPECPIDCPEQLADHPDLLASAPEGEGDGMYPSALALVTPPRIDPANPDSVLLFDEADKQVVDSALYVGGLGADYLFEIRYEGSNWVDALELELPDASGISVIRATPAMELPLDGGEAYHQFLYVIAGDGSTRVVRREFDENRDEIGIECDTQVDPTAVLGRVCHPAAFPGGDPPSRRPFARGPGIRAASGALITDWTFQKLVPCEGAATGKAIPPFPSYCYDIDPAQVSDAAVASSPFGQVGVIGVGSTSFGRLVFATFGQFFTTTDQSFGRNPAVNAEVDPMGLLDASILPHMLWPALDPTLARGQGLDTTGLPRMQDVAPLRTLPGDTDEANAIKVLAPALRRIDLAYSDDYSAYACNDKLDCPTAICGETTDSSFAACVEDRCGKGKPCVCPDEGTKCEEDADCGPNIKCTDKVCQTPADCVDQMICDGNQCGANKIDLLWPKVQNADQFGRSEAESDDADDGLYEKETVRAVVRDYRSWLGGDWRLIWEGEIPGSESLQGQLICENPGWLGGTCLSTEPGDTRIVDTTASFCEDGVLGGDKLALFACGADADCGEGQYCLIDPRTPGNASGICVSQAAYENTDALLEICEDLVYDPCGPPRREFLVTRAFQDELWLQAMDKPPVAYVMYAEAADKEGAPIDRDKVCSGEYVTDVVVNPDDHAQDPDELIKQQFECEARLACAAEQPESGCDTHADCVNQAREDQDPDDPTPFAETHPLCIDGVCRRVCGPDEDCVQRRLPGPACLRELIHYTVTARNSFVLTGPGSYGFLAQRVRTDEATGECYEDPAVSNLLTSRIRLGEDEADTRNNTAWPIPACPPGTERPDNDDPNPCFIDVVRPDGLNKEDQNHPARLFHQFEFGDVGDRAAVPAIRFSNPMMSLVLDLTSLQALSSPIPDHEELSWPTEFREFRRARIPRNFTESFTTLPGYSPFDIGVVTSNIALVGPTRIINAPEVSGVFIVDTSGGGGTTGVRGQVVRVGLAGGQVTPDTNFQVH